MRPHFIEVPAPVLDHHLCFGPRAEPFEGQALVAEFAVEALRRPILPRLARIDQCRLDALIEDPFQQRAGDELRPVAPAEQDSPCSAALRAQPTAAP